MPSRATIGYVLAAALLLVALIDGGSVLLTHMVVPDDTKAAGHAAAAAVEDQPPTKQAAVTAFEAAQAAATGDSLTVRPKGFTLYPDAKVTLTATRTAPTLVFHRLPWLSDLTIVSSTATVTTLPYS